MTQLNVATYAGPAESDTFDDLAACVGADLHWVFAIRADHYATQAWTEEMRPRDWDWLLAFGPDGELRFRSDEGRAWMTVAWTSASPPALPDPLPADVRRTLRQPDSRLMSFGSRTLLLWGISDGDEFLEGRFPRPIRYPVSVDAGQRLALEVEDYVDDGRITWTRPTGFTVVAGPGQEDLDA